MGNKSTTKNKIPESLETPIKPPPISRSSFELFIQCLHKLPFTLTEDQFENIIYDLEERTFSCNTTVIKAGQGALGIFVIVNGSCNVFASDDLTVINQLKKYDIFGEVSSLYDVPCTCTIQVGNDDNCHVVFLEYSKIKSMIHADSDLVPMEKWFIQKNYIDCASLFPLNQISKVVIISQMVQCPLFYDWSDNAINHLYEEIQKDYIEIYQPGVCIAVENDEEANIIILLNGDVEIIRNGKYVASLSSSDGCFCFQDESLFLENTRQLFTIKSITTCQIVTFTQEHFESITEMFATESSKLLCWCQKWNSFYENTDKTVMENYPDLIYYPILISTLKNTGLFSLSSHKFLYRLILGMVFTIHNSNNYILKVDNTDIQNIIILLKGSAEVFDGSKNLNLLTGDLFYFRSKQSGNKYIKATSECVVGYISNDLLQMVMDEFPDSVINLEC